MSKGTFFYHFRRKEDLLVELGWSTVDRVGEEAEEAYAQDGDLDRAMDVGLAGLARRIAAMPRGAWRAPSKNSCSSGPPSHDRPHRGGMPL